MEFTGERFIPEAANHNSMPEDHYSRYFFAAELVRGRRVLDLGCGTGYGSYHLSQKGAAFVLGLDVGAEAVRYASRHYRAPNLAFARSDALCLPLRPGSFDLVVSFEVLEHLQEVEIYLSGIGDVLHERGWLIGSTPNRLLSSPDVEQPYNPFHHREYDLAELEALLYQTFSEVVVVGQRPFHGLVIGAVPASADEDACVELLPEAGSMEDSVADSMFFVYLAGKQEASLDEVKSEIERPHYYLGRSASRHVMLQSKHIRELEAERDRLESLVRSYEAGKFMRLMRRLHTWRTLLFGG
jgi:SAM-dependent methyltransferase